MSDLQISLLAIGAAIVVAILAFNWFQERRFRNQANAAFESPVADVLMQPGSAPSARDPHKRVEPAFDANDAHDLAEAQEPHLHIDSNPVPTSAATTAADDMAHVMRAAAEVSAQPASAAAPIAVAPYDELIEYRIRLGSDGVQANALADAFSHTRTLGKSVRWIGVPVGATQWEEVQPWRDLHYQQLVVTMQLADRNGAVLEEQLTGLCEMVQTLAQNHGLRIACDDVVEALERAQAIDRFCVDVDVLIGLNVVARGEGAVNLTRIVREAEGSGMVLGMDGVFQLLDSRSEQLYALCNHDAEPFSNEVVEGQTSQGVTLQFDVPRVPDGLKVFDGMVAFGRKLANEVGGILVDDNLRPLTDTGIEKIRTQLAHIYERMEARGVPSGSRRALRLFS
ncbi:cell division protein ZipA C-terminal FtsZ-binding domain-containing protein [Thiobacillus sp.]|uniref:cell division protein ZipA C-terminal FtsZ-binding domain-containing protein n=1 Tax=Thiobacillus sp. TaxID=924 RepID=UPI00286DF26D|nr:cell division protein ZipA C-terminal FtsZ-binding domain-containing protein [Thiobacillus sp.]